MTRQLNLGDLSTTEIVAQIYARESKKSAGKKQSARNEAEGEFERVVRFSRLPMYHRHFVLPAFHLTPKLRRRATWEFDGHFPDFKLLVEIQGGVWMRGKGAHSHPVDLMRNFHKQNDAARQGYALLQFTPDEVVNGTALEYTMLTLADRYGWRR